MKSTNKFIFSSKYRETSTFLLCVLGAYVVTWYLQLGGRVSILGAIRLEFILGSFLILMSFVVKKDRIYRENPLKVILVWYIICVLLQVFLSRDYDTSWTVLVDRIIKFSMMALFISSYASSPRGLYFFFAAFFLAAFKMTSEGFTGWLFGGLVWQNQGIMRLHGVTGSYRHPNSFSGYAVGLLPFLYFLFPLAHKYLKLVLLVMAVWTVMIVIFTGSRTGYVGVVATFAYIFWISRNKKQFLKMFAVVIMAGAALVPPDYFGRFESIFTGKDKEGASTDARKEILRDAVDIFLMYPLGVGVGAFPKVRDETFNRQQDTHNLYLEILTNIGIQGFVVFMILVVKMLGMLAAARKSFELQLDKILLLKSRRQADIEDMMPVIDGHVYDVRLLLAVSSATYAFIVARLALGMFGMDLYEIYWWFGLGMAITLYRMEKVARGRTEQLLQTLDNSGLMAAELTRALKKS